MKKTITQQEHLQLVGLMTLARGHYKKVSDASEAMDDILESTDKERGWSLINDAIYDSQEPNVETVLTNMGVAIRE